EGLDLWRSLDNFFNATLKLDGPVPRGNFLSRTALSAPDQLIFFIHSHERLFSTIREQVVAKTEMTRDEFDRTMSIGLSAYRVEQRPAYAYARLAEIASLVKEGFAIPVCPATPVSSFINSGKPVIGVMFRGGPIQMHVLHEIGKRPDAVGVLTPSFHF